jgi:hypothetical protein
VTSAALELPGPIAVVMNERLSGQPGAPLPEELLGEISQLSARGALAARVEDRGRSRLAVCTERHTLHLTRSRYGDAYWWRYARRRTRSAEAELARGALLLRCAAGWHGYQDMRDVPRGSSAHWDEVEEAWADLDARRALDGRHARLLDLWSEVVDATRRIELARSLEAPSARYSRFEPAQAQRYSARGVYQFHVIGSPEVRQGARLFVVGRPELTGSVVDAGEGMLVVRFEGRVDHRDIPGQGALRALPNQQIYAAQRAAIETIRTGRTLAPDLLSRFVEGQLSPYRPDSDVRPRRELDEDQLRVLQRAVTVPDVLVVQGPPGTGKTVTIVEIVTALAGRQRVLLASHTNRAVDNVLGLLPPDVRVVRVGREDSMVGHARERMVDAQVGALVAQIRRSTDARATALDGLLETGEILGRQLEHLFSRLAAARDADAGARARAAELAAAARRMTATVEPRVRAAAAALAESRTAAEARERDLATWLLRREGAARYTRVGPLSPAARWLSGPLSRRVDEAELRLARARAAVAGAERAYETEHATGADAISCDPEVVRLSAARRAAESERDAALADVAEVASAVRGGLGPAGLEAPEPSGDLPSWERFGEWLRRAVPLARTRAGLLRDFRAQVGQSRERLEAEVIRYADVIAATCLGCGTNPLLDGEEFDLAIVDEAGQVSTPILLVAAVKARRMVLVGDHKQLPPFLDEDVRRWSTELAGKREDASEIADVLKKSAFERLHSMVGDDHRDLLRLQRRMPKALSDFVSEVFYGGQLRCAHVDRDADPLFRSRLVMIDTADRPPAERQRGSAEGWSPHGYENELEAKLIVDLVARYERWQADWGVIVPYLAQTKLVRTLVGSAIGGAARVGESINTVDAFQGGERDFIVYGLTRSNQRGDVGFLSELRRVNVAFSRARQQLVLVGDSRTLRGARDPGFARVMRVLWRHLGAAGHVVTSREFEAAVRGSAARP